MPDKPRPKPLYARIADDLRAEIKAGTYGPGDRLPGENKLMEQYKTSRGTARDALAILRDEGLTEARRGSGVFVRDFQLIRRNAVERCSRKRWGAGHSIWDADTADRTRREDTEVDTVDAPEHVATALGVPLGTSVVKRSRVHLIEGRPIGQSASYLLADMVAGSPITEVNPGPGGIYARLMDLGFAPERFREEVRVRMPLADQARVLKLPPGTPVIHIVRTAFAADDRPVEFNEMVLDSSSYLLEYDFPS